jgi:sphingomyelin phosphodiesterase
MGRFTLYLNSCKGFSRHFVPGLLDNLSELVLTPDYFCPLIGACEPNPIFMPMSANDDILKILADKPDYLKDDDFVDKLYESMLDSDSERKTISIIQFTDIHLDLDYKIGSSTTCNNMLCCRHEDGYQKDPKF